MSFAGTTYEALDERRTRSLLDDEEGLLSPYIAARLGINKERRKLSASSSYFPDQNTNLTLHEYLLKQYGDGCGYGTSSCFCTTLRSQDDIWSEEVSVNLTQSKINATAIADCESLRNLYFPYSKLTGTIPSELGSLPELTEVLLRGNELTGPIPVELADLGSETIFGWKWMILLDLAHNRLTGTIPSEFSDVNASFMDISNNLLHGNITRPCRPTRFCFFGLCVPSSVSLQNNRLCRVVSGFLDIPDKHMNYDDAGFVTIGAQHPADSTNGILELEEGAFRGIRRLDRILLTGSRITTLPPNLFNGYVGNNSALINLRNLGIETISSYAFNNTQNLSIDLRANFVTRVSPQAFPEGAFIGSTCADFLQWTVVIENYRAESFVGVTQSFNCSSFVDEISQNVCILGFTCLESSVGIPGSAGVSAAEACCELGGGHVFGRSFMMDASSPVFCRPSSETSDTIRCTCSSETAKFDLERESCVEICGSGMFWNATYEDSVDAFPTTLDVDTGACIMCPVGSIRPEDANDPFPDACTPCARGTFAGDLGQSTCKECEANTFSIDGASECEPCAYGRTSNAGDPQCNVCGTLYIGSNRCNTPILGLAIVAFAILVVSTFLCFVARARRKRRQLQASLNAQNELVKATADDLDLMSAGWRVREDEVHFDALIAKGGYGEVWKGVLRGTYTVAIKKMYPESNDADVDLEKNQEIRFLQRARHPRLVMFLGCGRCSRTERDDASIFVVLEYCDRGDLTHFLYEGHDASTRVPTWSERVGLLCDVAEGMEYLHLIHGSIHRDLKSDNVLLSSERGSLRAKVADFGLSKFMSTLNASDAKETAATKRGGRVDGRGTPRSSTMTSGVGTPVYMAPEICRTAKVNVAARYGNEVDVYAFGVILWETMHRKVPWGNFKFSHEILDNVEKGKRPPIDRDLLYTSPEDYVKLMKTCWSQDPSDRPQFDSIHEVMNEIRGRLYRQSSKLRAMAASAKPRPASAKPRPASAKPRPASAKPRPRPPRPAPPPKKRLDNARWRKLGDVRVEMETLSEM
eukprot:g3367.t1